MDAHKRATLDHFFYLESNIHIGTREGVQLLLDQSAIVARHMPYSLLAPDTQVLNLPYKSHPPSSIVLEAQTFSLFTVKLFVKLLIEFQQRPARWVGKWPNRISSWMPTLSFQQRWRSTHSLTYLSVLQPCRISKSYLNRDKIISS